MLDKTLGFHLPKKKKKIVSSTCVGEVIYLQVFYKFSISFPRCSEFKTMKVQCLGSNHCDDWS